MNWSVPIFPQVYMSIVGYQYILFINYYKLKTMYCERVTVNNIIKNIDETWTMFCMHTHCFRI